jgi:quercetin dioxygenase-like cupin family protein
VIETVTAGQNIRELCAVNGIELYFIGPADYSSSAGYRGQWEGPGVAAELLAIKDTVRNCGKQCGIISTSLENLIERRQQGFCAIGLGSDCALLLRSLRAALATVGHDRRILPDFQPQPLLRAPSAAAPLARPPESVRPDRPEVVTEPGAGPPVELAPGVALDVLVGARNNARGLTTGLVTFQPNSGLPYHTHPVTESITVLSGEFLVAVEGREYRLRILDNLVIPRGLPHQTRNASLTQPGVLHAAMASATPTRDLVSTQFEARPAPNGSTGVPGKERVTTFNTAPRSLVTHCGPGTSFIDHFNQELVPGIEMSGGYGLFQPGGRLPAHFHDFDESICIIDGTATAVVEGRRYSMASYSTALQPRGRVHYFINESDRPMAMLWVYAGPVPERIVVDERCALPGGDPWKE